MIDLGHGAIVTDKIIFEGSQRARLVLPGARVFYVRLIQQFSIDVNMAFMESDRLTGQANDPFHEHNAGPGQTNGHDVTAPGFVEEISHAIDEIDAAFAVSRKHARAGNADGQQDEFRHQKTDYHQNDDSLHRSPGVPADND